VRLLSEGLGERGGKGERREEKSCLLFSGFGASKGHASKRMKFACRQSEERTAGQKLRGGATGKKVHGQRGPKDWGTHTPKTDWGHECEKTKRQRKVFSGERGKRKKLVNEIRKK